jgi:hypothetical protein
MAERGFSLSEERIEQAPWRGRLLTYRRAGM